MLPILLPDSLALRDDGFILRIALPWIRSLPLASLTDLEVSIDGAPADILVTLGDTRVAPAALAREAGWWFLQDRLTLHGPGMLRHGVHDVSVSFRLTVPYLQAGPTEPLSLPFHAEASLEPRDAASLSPAAASAESAPAVTVRSRPRDGKPAGAGEWTIGASAFNWTPEVIRAEREASDIVLGIVEDGVASTVEIEPGQLWRSFPVPADADVDAFRTRVEAANGRVSLVGASLDDWALPARRRTEDERLAFLEPQIRAAARLGATGVRVPFGQAGAELLRRAQPMLAELDVVLYEEIQGQQTLDAPAVAEAFELLRDLDDPRIRVLIDISMLMPSLPPSYLAALRRAGVDRGLIDRLEHEWRSPETHAAVLAALRDGAVPPSAHTLFMNLLVRFGRSSIDDIEPLLPLTGGVHLKFWDLDDADGRVSQPIADIGAALHRVGFTGSLTSEWGGHEWLSDDAATMTRAHLALAHEALAAGATAR